MIDSLDIKGFRNLAELRIDALSRVNLITGKNNTGKSTLLEAISLYATKCDMGIILQLLEERGEITRINPAAKNISEYNIKAFSSLFTDRIIDFSKTHTITFGTRNHAIAGAPISSENSFSIRFVKYYNEITSTIDEPVKRRKRTVIDDDDVDLAEEYQYGIEIRTGNNYIISPLDSEMFFKRIGFNGFGNTDSVQFIRTRNIDREINGALWDAIALTDKEQYVIEALKIIEPLVERIAFIEKDTQSRSAVIKLSNSNSIYPIRSMGDGINRILTIILALVNAENGYLLIDEFENGLHYSTQEKLWEIIFSLANKLNVQIFATTHSEDCIAGFESVLNNPQNSVDGKLIRLDNINGTIKQVVYSKDELKVATYQNIETR